MFKNHPTNKRCGNEEYPQTWWIVSKLNPTIKKIIQFLCMIFGGHEPSKTEWGYSGGEYADSWCRWCNKMIKVPKTSVYFRSKDSKPLMDLIDKETLM